MLLYISKDLKRIVLRLDTIIILGCWQVIKWDFFPSRGIWGVGLRLYKNAVWLALSRVFALDLCVMTICNDLKLFPTMGCIT